MTDPAYDKLLDHIERFNVKTPLASIEDRVIECNVLRAACTEYIAAHAPDGWAAFSAHVSRVIQHVEQKKFNKKTLFE
jgi:hypothetical protein